jgi:hypothetical protein
MFKNESHYEINNDRTSERKKRKINEIHTNGCCINAKFFTPPGTNPKRLLFKPLNYLTDHNKQK